jgi:hypothetical protein
MLSKPRHNSRYASAEFSRLTGGSAERQELPTPAPFYAFMSCFQGVKCCATNMDTQVVCQSLETRKRYRFLAKKAIETLQAYISDVCHTCPYKEICLMRCYHSFSAVGPSADGLAERAF